MKLGKWLPAAESVVALMSVCCRLDVAESVVALMSVCCRLDVVDDDDVDGEDVDLVAPSARVFLMSPRALARRRRCGPLVGRRLWQRPCPAV